MSKLNKKKKAVTPVNTASLPDIVFMLCFFLYGYPFYECTTLVKMTTQSGSKLKNWKKDRFIYIYAGKGLSLRYASWYRR
jgi:hypothetical protein